MKNAKKADWLRVFTAAILAAVFLYSAVRLIVYWASSASNRETNEELKDLFLSASETPVFEATIAEPTSEPSVQETQLSQTYQYIGGKVVSSLKDLLARNPDTVAWLQVSGGIVDLPVVYRDNTYYLDHDFNGKKSKSGTLFLDEMHPFLPDTQYLVIHGHNMQDGSMFGLLSHYRRKGYMKEHPTVTLTTLYRQEQYEVIGVLEVPIDAEEEGYVPYIGMRKFQSEKQFNDFVEMLRENALYWKSGAQVKPSDALMALSTCYEDDRVVVMCRRKSPK